MTHIKNNLVQVKHQISQACQLANRSIDEVLLLAVSKTKPSAMVEQAYHAGQRFFGESYIQEAIEKIEQLSHLTDIQWHFIGPIQSNKTRHIAELFSWVHSVDRAKIITRLNEQRSEQDTPLNVCLQVNISGESSKSGIKVNELAELAQLTDTSSHLTLRGIMAIPEKNASIASYQKMQQLFQQLQQQYPSVDTLSMGMSSDLTVAIAHGATIVRIGTAIFGQRETIANN
ncbi:YggS family pyridoxal phosphate enzyme [Thalassotalea insulae]|uniref:Pyridoxal phosphate homeostasis protein n=1 Tax=Thalassotalea insulae TaxID=2056778 RepID=A0ABQ6GRJ0_9GAMM|nr:YggS family pyridoxal phosphate-dependent enzyme [Thalassotalea insulae]GLX77035.1 YggS family pyridoxal phosphate enzyme [Thalassotalea insulae]